MAEVTANKENKKKGLVLLIIAVIVVLACGLGLGIYNTPENRLMRSLETAQKYLLEQDYEQAILAFEQAIAIDERCIEAYLGGMEAYAQLGEEQKQTEFFEKALNVARTLTAEELEAEKESVINIYLKAEEIYVNEPEKLLEILREGYEKTGAEILLMKVEALEKTLEGAAVANTQVEAEAWEIHMDTPISLQEFFSAPSVCGVCWYDCELPGFGSLIAALPPEQYSGTTEPKPWYQYELNEMHHYDMAIQITCGPENDAGYSDLRIYSYHVGEGDLSRHDIQYGYMKNEKDIRVYCEYAPGVPANPYCGGFYNYMSNNGFTTVEDVLIHWGIDVDSLKEGKSIIAETEYGVMRLSYCPGTDLNSGDYNLYLYESMEDFQESAKVYVTLRNYPLWGDEEGIISIDIDDRGAYLYDKLRK